ncbi:M56 family metallopeptidase [Agriterribacter humi]|uniref:M56 family metallopeptidase n=1 Tax=Agriterribacter humi TaxID=1104781 RepID=UPI0012656491|nr:M56 family metallopeptidase [Agriterribacter humi]
MIEYLIKSTLCLLFLYLVYVIMFRRSRNYHINRVVLLFSVIFPLLAPLFKITPAEIPVADIQQVEVLYKIASYQHYVQTSVPAKTLATENSTDLWRIVLIAYSIICFVFLIRFATNISILSIKARKSDKTDHNGTKLTLIDENIDPFTFMGYIFINRTYYERHVNEEMIVHEIAHKKQFHSADIVLVEFIQVFFWFNPFIHLFKKLIRANHEFLADDYVIRSGIRQNDYSLKLLNHTVKSRQPLAFASGFNHLLINQRLTMLSKFNQKRRPAYQLALFIPLIMVLFFTTAFKTTAAKTLGSFYAERLVWSAETKQVWIYGEKMIVKFGSNDFTGSGRFSGFGQVNLLVVDGKKAVLDSSILVSGKKCEVIILTKDEAAQKYGADGRLGVIEINTSR